MKNVSHLSKKEKVIINNISNLINNQFFKKSNAGKNAGTAQTFHTHKFKFLKKHLKRQKKCLEIIPPSEPANDPFFENIVIKNTKKGTLGVGQGVNQVQSWGEEGAVLSAQSMTFSQPSGCAPQLPQESAPAPHGTKKKNKNKNTKSYTMMCPTSEGDTLAPVCCCCCC